MEQQTISISKAGNITTLIARTSILTVASPLYGRHNPKVSPVEDVNLPAAPLSRFDLLLLLLDKPSRDDDERLAPTTSPNASIHRPRPPVSPCCPSRRVILHRRLYVRLRKQSKDDVQRDHSHTHTSARAGFSDLRLAYALARLRFAAAVLHADVDEAGTATDGGEQGEPARRRWGRRRRA
ncbi:MCM2/3/5 family-domain-containing protein [Lactarius akahatsu]|uniref:MCM2/3/5 family-domain-containing protein n=1 Tax=Lactarius akahatsu TaxID=416441 RepID=A0AAD4QHT6_9AGAM|nr:MCM2/3/5 family-domain-containing protein [Lactarius akahatsu]